MAAMINPYFNHAYKKYPSVKKLRELIEIASERDDIDELVEAIDRLIEDGLDGAWSDDGEVYCLSDDETFDGTDSALEYVKDEMSAAKWVDIIADALSEKEEEEAQLREGESAYIEGVAQRLGKEDVACMIDLLQRSYEEQCQDDDDYNPYAFEQRLRAAGKVDLVAEFISHFSVPNPHDAMSESSNVDWLPESLLIAFDLHGARDTIRQSQQNQARRVQLMNLLEKLGPLSYPGIELRFLCETINNDIPRRRRILDQIEEMIKEWHLL